MINEEKIKEIVFRFIPNEDYDNAMSLFYAKKALAEMAQWKDEQLRQILENIHEDCPKSKAKHYLTLLKNNAL